MNILSQEARKRQAVVMWAEKKGKADAARKYGVSYSSVKRWCKRYDGNWRSLLEKSHRPKNSPRQHTAEEEQLIRRLSYEKFERYGWEGVYMAAKAEGYTRSLSGLIYAAKRMGLVDKTRRKPPRKHDRKFPEMTVPGEKVQIDVKEVPYSCMRGKLLKNNARAYQWTAIDECTRIRFVYAFDEHTPANTLKFYKMLEKAFPFPIQCVQTDNGTEFTYKFISDEQESALDQYLKEKKIPHKLIPPRTPWHNGKVERSHRSDQRYFYNWETFRDLDEINSKLAEHLKWSNNKPMGVLNGKSPAEMLKIKLDELNGTSNSGHQGTA